MDELELVEELELLVLMQELELDEMLDEEDEELPDVLEPLL